MNRFIPVAVLISMIALSGMAAEAPVRVDPSEHIRIVYDRFSAPDSMIFASLLNYIRTYAEDYSEEELVDWVWSEMNMTYSLDREAWLTPQLETARHSRAEIREFVDLLLEVADRSLETGMNLRRELFCPSDKFTTMQQKIEALERRDIDKQLDAEYYMNDTMERIDEQSGADLRAWLSRMKVGFKAWLYNYRTMWEGRDSGLDQEFTKWCETFGENQ